MTEPFLKNTIMEETYKEEEIGHRTPVFKLLGQSRHGDVPTFYMDGNEKFRRLLVQIIGWKTYLGNGEYELELKQGITEEEFQKAMEEGTIRLLT